MYLEVDQLVESLRQTDGSGYNYWLWSEELTPDLRLEQCERVNGICSHNGLVLVQHGLMRRGAKDRSRIAIIEGVVNLDTGEERRHDGYAKVYRTLRRVIDKHLVYSAVHRFRDGHEEEDDRVQRMTEGAVREYEAGVKYAVRPGRRLPTRNVQA